MNFELVACDSPSSRIFVFTDITVNSYSGMYEVSVTLQVLSWHRFESTVITVISYSFMFDLFVCYQMLFLFPAFVTQVTIVPFALMLDFFVFVQLVNVIETFTTEVTTKTVKDVRCISRQISFKFLLWTKTVATFSISRFKNRLCNSSTVPDFSWISISSPPSDVSSFLTLSKSSFLCSFSTSSDFFSQSSLKIPSTPSSRARSKNLSS